MIVDARDLDAERHSRLGAEVGDVDRIGSPSTAA
jgi:hypothetical protein